MTKRDDLLAVAERCEKASEGSRELDGDIAAALRLHPQGWRRGASEASASAVWFDDFYNWRAPDFTTSLDAALSLGGLCVFASDIGADGLPMVKIVADTSKIPVAEHTGIARTLELAWCAATLRAQAEMEG